MLILYKQSSNLDQPGPAVCCGVFIFFDVGALSMHCFILAGQKKVQSLINKSGLPLQIDNSDDDDDSKVSAATAAM